MPRISAKKKFELHQKLLRKSKQDPVTLYLETLAPSGRRSVCYLLGKAARLLGFAEDVKEVPWHLLEYQHVVQIRTKMIRAGYSVNTINLMLAGIKGVAGACFDLGLNSAEEMLRIKKLRRVRGEQNRKGRALTQAQVVRLVGELERKTSLVATRDLAILSLLLATGLRRSELCNLKRADYNARNGEIIVRSGKGRNTRVVHLNVSGRRRLKKWLDATPSDIDWLFLKLTRRGSLSLEPLSGSDIYLIVRARAHEAGIGHLAPHDLRRTFVTCLLESGVDINIVRQLAGHKQLETTSRYDKRNISSNKKALETLSRLGL